jgi:hypothetical protein
MLIVLHMEDIRLNWWCVCSCGVDGGGGGGSVGGGGCDDGSYLIEHAFYSLDEYYQFQWLWFFYLFCLFIFLISMKI